mmetsp:Transcript_36001/g.107666  ORF Transcript_36001/g.107666 Transcript_36001/m.107666 type:complete len:346 (+) Transcript_36001:1537-2574(+)
MPISAVQPRPVLQDTNRDGRLSRPRGTLHQGETVRRGALHGQPLRGVEPLEGTVLVQGEAGGLTESMVISSSSTSAASPTGGDVAVFAIGVGVLLVCGRPGDGLPADGRGGGEVAAPQVPPHVTTLEHGLIDVLVHGRDGLDDVRAGPPHVGLAHHVALGPRRAYAHGGPELTVEAHPVGELVDAVDVPVNLLGEHGVEAGIGLVLETEDEGIDTRDGRLNHVPVEGLGRHGVGAGVGEDAHGISRLNAPILRRVAHKDAQLMSRLDDHLGGLLPPPQPRVDDAHGAPDQSLAWGAADSVAGAGRLLEELEGDAPRDPEEVGPRRGGIEPGGDAQGIDAVGGRVC